MLRRESSSLLAPPELVAEGGSVGRMRRVGQAELLALGPPQAAGHRPGPAAAGPTGPGGRKAPAAAAPGLCRCIFLLLLIRLPKRAFDGDHILSLSIRKVY